MGIRTTIREALARVGRTTWETRIAIAIPILLLALALPVMLGAFAAPPNAGYGYNGRPTPTLTFPVTTKPHTCPPQAPPCQHH